MEIFYSLFIKILPLYLTIGLGFVAGRALSIDGRQIGLLILYVIMPIVVFDSIARVELSMETLVAPLITLTIAAGMCLTMERIARRIWPDARANILAMMAGTGNTGYFGLPLAFILFDAYSYSLYVAAMMGFVLYESTLGYYMCAKSSLTPKQAVLKVLKLPALYAYIAAVLWSLSGETMPLQAHEFLQNFHGMYVVAGMMIIGLSLAPIQKMPINLKFIGLAFTAKFVVWPLVTLGLILLDKTLLQLFDARLYPVLLLISIVPLPVNAIVFANVLQAFPEKVAATVMLGAVFAVLYVPFMVAWLL